MLASTPRMIGFTLRTGRIKIPSSSCVHMIHVTHVIPFQMHMLKYTHRATDPEPRTQTQTQMESIHAHSTSCFSNLYHTVPGRPARVLRLQRLSSGSSMLYTRSMKTQLSAFLNEWSIFHWMLAYLFLVQSFIDRPMA